MYIALVSVVLPESCDLALYPSTGVCPWQCADVCFMAILWHSWDCVTVAVATTESSDDCGLQTLKV